MRRALIAAFFLFGLTAAFRTAMAEEGFRVSKAEQRRQVLAVIEQQLAAFRERDASKAYSYSTTALQAQMPLRRFAAIVRENYAEIWENTRAEFGLVRDDGTHATVLVHVFSPRGEAGYDYVLLKERRGWRIGSITRHEPTRKNNV